MEVVLEAVPKQVLVYKHVVFILNQRGSRCHSCHGKQFHEKECKITMFHNIIKLDGLIDDIPMKDIHAPNMVISSTSLSQQKSNIKSSKVFFFSIWVIQKSHELPVFQNVETSFNPKSMASCLLGLLGARPCGAALLPRGPEAARGAAQLKQRRWRPGVVGSLM